MHKFKVGDLVRARPSSDCYLVSNSAETTVLRVIRTTAHYIRVIVEKHALQFYIGDTLSVCPDRMSLIRRSRIVTTSCQYEQDKGLSDEDKSIIRKYLESEAV